MRSKPNQLSTRDLKSLPFKTLRQFAVAIADDIDKGEDKHQTLEMVFEAISQGELHG